MPAQKTKRRKPRNEYESNLVPCTCELYCKNTNWNAAAQKYEGVLIPESTRRDHRRDERNARLAQSPQFREQQLGSGPDLQWYISLDEELQVLSHTPLIHQNAPLVFAMDPTSTPFEPDVEAALLRPNYRPFSLANIQSNRLFLEVELRLSEVFQLLQSFSEGEIQRDERLEVVKDIMARIIQEKHMQWNNQRYPGSESHHVNTEIFFYRGRPRSKAYRCAVLTSLVLKHLYATPLRAIRTHLAGLRSVLRSANLSVEEINLLPKDPRTITNYYQLHPITRRYVCCPACSFIYIWDGKSRDDPQCTIPSNCTYKRAVADPECNAGLWKTRRLSGNRTHYTPIRSYTHQPLKYWLGRLLSRPGIEDHIDNSRNITSSPDGVLDDIWGSPCMTSLKGHDNQPFLPGPPTEGRLIFSLAIDSFDPHEVKAARQSISSTGIWLSLLNLPPHLRYLRENMYVAGVIPGPQKPSKEEINHYVDLVVDDLLEAFHLGIHLSRTHKYELGRLYKAMLVPLVCDMLAARQVIGQPAAPSAHSFCTACDLDKDDIDILDKENWPAKDIEHVRHYAQLWKSATTTAEKESLFDCSAIRWTPLLRLPYWDPAKFTVIDAMHTLDLGLFSNHCRSLFALACDAKSGDGTSLSPAPLVNKRIYTKAHIAGYKECLEIVAQNDDSMESQLLVLDRKVLYTFCDDNSITRAGRDVVAGTKWVLARSIVDWRNSPVYMGPKRDIAEVRANQEMIARQSQEREPTPEVASTDYLKNFFPVIRLLLQPTTENIEKLLSLSSKKIYIQVCDVAGIDYSGIDLKKQTAKRQLQEHVLEKLSEDETYVERLSELLPKHNQRVVLGKEVMEIVWSDMKKTQTPTWVSTAPPDWGTKSRGKLSAAQWRVICSIHLVVTLIRLWSEQGARKKLMLDHFMDLVCAVRIANMKTSSPDQIAAYNKHMGRYVSNIRRLYPDTKLKPTHHCALHIGDFLESMGPTHSHDSPFFERYINSFHHKNNNAHPSEVEATLLDSTACDSNLRGLMADEKEIRPLVCEMIDTMDAIDREDIRGFRLASILDPNAPTSTSGLKGVSVELSPSRETLWKECLQKRGESDTIAQRRVLSLPQIALKGVCYSTVGHFHRNSVIMFSESASSSSVKYGDLKAAFVDLIFQTSTTPPAFYLLIRELLPVVETSDHKDPYKQYGFAGGFLCRQHHQHLRVIHLDQLNSHAAITPLNFVGFGDVYHVLCIDRMMNIFSTFDYD